MDTHSDAPRRQLEQLADARCFTNNDGKWLFVCDRPVDPGALLAAWDEREREMELLRAEVKALRETMQAIADGETESPLMAAKIGLLTIRRTQSSKETGSAIE